MPVSIGQYSATGQNNRDVGRNLLFGERMRHLLSPSREEKLVAVLKAYLDESGIEGRKQFCVVAGFVASCKRWDEFEVKYRRAVGDDAIEPGFHAHEFFARDEEGQRVNVYRGWNDDRASALLHGLVDSIRRVDIHPIGAVVDVQVFQQYTLEQRRYLTGGYRNPFGKHKLQISGSPERPYYVPFQSVVIQSAAMLKRSDWKVNFVFDQQDVFSGFANVLYTHIKDKAPMKWQQRMGSLVFDSRQDALPLQAADLIAYCTHKIQPVTPEKLNPSIEMALDVFIQKKYHIDFFIKDKMDRHLSNAGHHIP